MIKYSDYSATVNAEPLAVLPQTVTVYVKLVPSASSVNSTVNAADVLPAEAKPDIIFSDSSPPDNQSATAVLLSQLKPPTASWRLPLSV